MTTMSDIIFEKVSIDRSIKKKLKHNLTAKEIQKDLEELLLIWRRNKELTEFIESRIEYLKDNNKRKLFE